MEREYRDLANEYTNGTICCPYHPVEGTYYLIPPTWKMKDFKEFVKTQTLKSGSSPSLNFDDIVCKKCGAFSKANINDEFLKTCFFVSEGLWEKINEFCKSNKKIKVHVQIDLNNPPLTFASCLAFEENDNCLK